MPAPKSPEYKALHHWINSRFPRTGECELCGRDDKRTCYSSIEHRYTKDRADWLELCYSCHRNMDAPGECHNGHPHTTGNVHIDKLGKRHCLVCQSERGFRNRRAAGIQPFPHRKSGNPGPRQHDEKGRFVCAS